MVEALEIIAKPTALGVIVCLAIAVISLGMAYKFGTAETHEQCIIGDQTQDGGECYEYETRPGPDTKEAFFFGWLGITFLAFAVHSRHHKKTAHRHNRFKMTGRHCPCSGLR